MAAAATGISVLMPVYNGRRFLSEAIESVLAQTHDDLEMVIVDDGSTDDSAAVVSRYGHRDSRVRLLQREHRGIVSALNVGLRACGYPLVARMDADDVAFPTRLALQRQFLEDHSECVAVGTQVQQIDASGELISAEIVPLEHSEIVHRTLHYGCAMWHPSVIYRRDVVLAIGGYRAECEWAEDLDLWLRLSDVGRLANLEQPLLKYRIHEAKVCNMKRREQRVLGRKIVREYCETHCLPIPKRCRPSWSQLLRGNAWDAIGNKQPWSATISGVLAVCCNPMHTMNYHVTALALRDVYRSAVQPRPQTASQNHASPPVNHVSD